MRFGFGKEDSIGRRSKMTGIQIRPGKEKTRGGGWVRKGNGSLFLLDGWAIFFSLNGVAKFNVKSEPRPRWEEGAVR